jgi:hypothetical protein
MTNFKFQSLLTNVVSMNPAVVCRTILRFEKDVLVVFSGDDLHTPRYLSRFGLRLL